MSELQNTRKHAADIIQTALEKRIDELKQTEDFAALKTEIQRFESDGSKNLWFDESGNLVMRETIYIPRSLCDDGDIELIEALLKECSDVLYFCQNDYSQGYFEWTMEQCLGEPIIFNDSPERNSYAIYSQELGLKINRRDYTDEEHGMLIIEKAQREHGIFGDIVSTGACGDAFYVSIPQWVRDISDADLDAKIKAKEDSAP